MPEKKLKATVMRDLRPRDMDKSMSDTSAWKGIGLMAVFELWDVSAMLN